jgi:hypothetical protein
MSVSDLDQFSACRARGESGAWLFTVLPGSCSEMASVQLVAAVIQLSMTGAIQIGPPLKG